MLHTGCVHAHTRTRTRTCACCLLWRGYCALCVCVFFDAATDHCAPRAPERICQGASYAYAYDAYAYDAYAYDAYAYDDVTFRMLL